MMAHVNPDDNTACEQVEPLFLRGQDSNRSVGLEIPFKRKAEIIGSVWNRVTATSFNLLYHAEV